MKKFKQYSFYIGLVGAILALASVILNFFGVVDIMPIITEIVAIISALLVSVGLVEKGDSKDKTFSDLKSEIKNDLDKNAEKLDDKKDDQTLENKK